MGYVNRLELFEEITKEYDVDEIFYVEENSSIDYVPINHRDWIRYTGRMLTIFDDVGNLIGHFPSCVPVKGGTVLYQV